MSRESAGTIYLKDNALPLGVVRVDNEGRNNYGASTELYQDLLEPIRVTAHRNSDGSRIWATDDDGQFEMGPLVPGSWSVQVRTNDYPRQRLAARDLATDDVWDTGDIRLAAGGTVRVTVCAACVAFASKVKNASGFGVRSSLLGSPPPA